MPSARDGSGQLSSNLSWIGQVAPVDEAHFRAEAGLRGKWVLKGEPAQVDSTSPQYGEKASYYSAVCLETGEVEWMDASAGSAGGQQQLRDLGCFLGTVAPEAREPSQRDLGQRAGPLWQAQEGREVQGVPVDLRSEPEASEPPSPRGQALPGYSPDFNADEALWGWAREEALGNLCLGSRTAVQERVWKFLDGRKDEVKRGCRTVLQSRAEAFLRDSQPDFQVTSNAHLTLALV